MTLLILLGILLVFCLFYKIIVSCITKYMTETLIKILRLGNLKQLAKYVVL